MNEKTLSETDIRSKYITLAIVQAGLDLQAQIREGRRCPLTPALSPGGEGEAAALRAPIGPEAGWHANLLLVHYYRCVLFTHDETPLSFIVCRPVRLDAEHLPELLGQGLFEAPPPTRGGSQRSQCGPAFRPGKEKGPSPSAKPLSDLAPRDGLEPPT